MNIVNDCWDSQIHQSISQYASTQLWRHIRANAKESEAEEKMLNLINLSKKDLNLLADIRFLLSDNVRELIWVIAPKIISRLSKASVNETITDRNKVNGRINWSKTIAVRSVSGNDSSLFVYSRRAQVFDLPENRLFLHLIRQINHISKSFVSDEYLKLTWYAEAEFSGKWVNKISVIASKTEKMLKVPVVAKINSVNEINPKFISIAHRSRQIEYKILASAGEKYLCMRQEPLQYLKQELNGNILEPLNKDSLYEIAVLFKTMETAENCGWHETKAGLIGGTSDTAGNFRKDDALLKIYTQHIPREFKAISVYGPLMLRYGLSERLRRPDIIIEVIVRGKKKFLIVEVKRSKQRTYLADGTYKLLGYLKDFEKVKRNAELSGFLTGWSGIDALEYTTDEEVGLFDWNTYSQGIETYLNNII